MAKKVLTYEERLKTINNIKLEDICEHHARTHTTNNLRFVIAGKITPARKEKIYYSFRKKSRSKKGERFEIISDELSKPKGPIFIHRPDLKNISFGISLLLPRKLTTSEMDAMHALNHI